MYLVSACLTGQPCRYDGASVPVAAIRELFGRGEAVPVCPEVLGGLATPRTPSERQPDGRVVNREGRDVTAEFRLGAEKALAVCQEAGCTCAILKARSPSCGKGIIYDGSFSRKLVPGNGVCAELLMQKGIRIITEEEYLMQKNKIQDRIRGSLIAGAAGDALGYAVEFLGESSIRNAYGPKGIRSFDLDRGTDKAIISDDTQMTLFTAAGILDGKNGLRSSIARAYQNWLMTQDYDRNVLRRKPKQEEDAGSLTLLMAEAGLYAPRAPGNTCLSALRTAWAEGDPEDLDFIAHPRNHSKGCGGVMRAAPAAWIPGLDADSIVIEGAQLAAQTHGNPLGWLCAAALAHIVRRMTFTELPLKEITFEACAALRRLFSEYPETESMCALMEQAVELSENSLPDLDNIHELGEGWVGDEALAISLYCALRHENDVSACLIAAVNHRGDSDSTGAISGNIVGARVGYNAMDEKWKNDLEHRELILKIADRLAEAADPSEL